MSTAPYNKGDKVVCITVWHFDHEVLGAVRTVASCEQSRITGKWYIRLVELADVSSSHNYDAARYRPAVATDYPAPQPAAPQGDGDMLRAHAEGRYTKRPITIDAIRWTGKNLREVIAFTDGPPDTRTSHAGMAWDTYVDLVERDGLKIFTLEGKMSAAIGDWIIKGVQGEHYPCKPDIFEATYSAALAASAPVAPTQSIVTLRPDGSARDPRDIASDPEGKLMHSASEPLRAAVAPAPQPAPMPYPTDAQIDAVYEQTMGQHLRSQDAPAVRRFGRAMFLCAWNAAAPKAAPAPAPVSGESDPTGLSAHEAGAKLDSGKLRPALVLGGFANALLAVTKVGTDGANKYTDNGWKAVPNGLARYEDALHRHLLKHQSGEKVDPDSGSTHLAHVAWNALALIELTKEAEWQSPTRGTRATC